MPLPVETRLSDRLIALLKAAKDPNVNYTLEGVAIALEPIYCDRLYMRITDAINHLIQALLEVSREPRFSALSQPESWIHSMLMFPLYNISPAENIPVKKLYEYFIQYAMDQLRWTRVDWCKDQLYPKERS